MDIPRDISVDQLLLRDETGACVELDVLGHEEVKAGIYHPRNRNLPFQVRRFRILFDTGTLPALGYKVFQVDWEEQDLYPYPHEEWEPIKLPYAPLAANARQAENEFVRIEFAPDGTFDLTSKETGRTFPGMNYFIDGGESGNLYTHRPPEVDRLITSQGTPARISLEINTPLQAVFQVETEMTVPACMDKSSGRRSDDDVIIPIRSRVTLCKDSPVVDVETTVTNTARDHFLRVCFPTGVQAECTRAGGVLDVNRYPTRVSRDGRWQGQELTRHQQHQFMDISDGSEGLAVLNDTLRDYEVLDADGGVIAQSLVRSVPLRIPVDNRLWMDYPGDESAQSLRTHTVRYGLMPHAGDLYSGNVLPRAVAYSSRVRTAQIGRQSGALPLNKSFLQIEGGLIMTAFTKAETRDAAVVRVYNPAEVDVKACLSFGTEVGEAHLVNLNEERQEQLTVSGGDIALDAGAKQVLSIEVVPAG